MSIRETACTLIHHHACESPGWRFIAGSGFKPRLDNWEASVLPSRSNCQYVYAYPSTLGGVMARSSAVSVGSQWFKLWPSHSRNLFKNKYVLHQRSKKSILYVVLHNQKIKKTSRRMPLHTYIHIYIYIKTCGVWRALPRSPLDIVLHQSVTSNPEASARRLCQTDKDYMVSIS